MSEHGASSDIGRRDFLRLGSAAVAAAALDVGAMARGEGRSPSTKRPNIVFVFSDEHRWCSLPFTEMPQVVAPNMERLARQGMRFDNCCSTSPICIPYRGMLITGQWPHQSSILSNHYFGNPNIIGKESPTVAQTFKDAGYVTGYVGKWHLEDGTAGNAGFDYFKHWQFGDRHWKTPVRDVPSGEDFKTVEGYNAIGMTDQALEFVDQHAGGEKPFMMMLSLNPPHWRWDDAPDEFVAMYPKDELTFRPNVTKARYKRGRELEYYQHYHAHISAVDRQLGRIMDSLASHGIEEDTILIYTSDHGSSFGSNGVGSKANPYDESIRVPFLVRWPGRIAADSSVDNLMGTIDLFPTLCGLAGVTPPAQCSGQDFSPVMLGRRGPDPTSQLIAVNSFGRNYFRERLDPDGPNGFYPFRGVRTKRYTYVVKGSGEWMLYDNKTDPYQMNNLVDDPAHAATKAAMRRELDGWLVKAEDPYIPVEWRALPLHERIAHENEHFTLLKVKRFWDKYKAEAIEPYLAGDVTDAQKAQLREMIDRVCDADYYGLYTALHQSVNGPKRHSQRSKAQLAVELAEHERAFNERLKVEAQTIVGANR